MGAADERLQGTGRGDCESGIDLRLREEVRAENCSDFSHISKMTVELFTILWYNLNTKSEQINQDLRRINMTVDVYENCPIYENEYYMLRMTNKEDKADLLKVYSDEKSVPFFNSDNCGGDDFYYTTEKRMEQAIEFWHWEYDRQGFVRWTIVSKETNEAVGTIELFHREAEDYFTNCGLLRLDIRSDYEITSEIVKILELIIEPAYVLFQCDKIATKAIDLAVERISALKRLGFKYSEEKLIGHDGTEYDSYYVLEQ